MHRPRKEWFSLTEASRFSPLPVHRLKEMISEGRLEAERRGFVVISRSELIRLAVEVTGKCETRVEYDLKAFEQYQKTCPIFAL